MTTALPVLPPPLAHPKLVTKANERFICPHLAGARLFAHACVARQKQAAASATEKRAPGKSVPGAHLMVCADCVDGQGLAARVGEVDAPPERKGNRATFHPRAPRAPADTVPTFDDPPRAEEEDDDEVPPEAVDLPAPRVTRKAEPETTPSGRYNRGRRAASDAALEKLFASNPGALTVVQIAERLGMSEAGAALVVRRSTIASAAVDTHPKALRFYAANLATAQAAVDAYRAARAGKPTRPVSTDRCQVCGKPGHARPDCPKRKVPTVLNEPMPAAHDPRTDETCAALDEAVEARRKAQGILADLDAKPDRGAAAIEAIVEKSLAKLDDKGAAKLIDAACSTAETPTTPTPPEPNMPDPTPMTAQGAGGAANARKVADTNDARLRRLIEERGPMTLHDIASWLGVSESGARKIAGRALVRHGDFSRVHPPFFGLTGEDAKRAHDLAYSVPAKPVRLTTGDMIGSALAVMRQAREARDMLVAERDRLTRRVAEIDEALAQFEVGAHPVQPYAP